MTYKELNKKILAKLAELEKVHSDFTIASIDEDEDWYENLEDWEGKVNYGSLSNYLIFLEKKDDGIYVSIVCETEPLMVTNNWLFGKGIQPSELDYEFSGSAYDVANDFSYDEVKPIWEEKV